MTRVAPGPAPVRAAARVPGSKYEANRLLIAAALTEGETRLLGLPDGDDIRIAAAAIGAIGANIREDGDALVVTGAPSAGDASAPLEEIAVTVGESGTLFRFLTAASATIPRPVTLRGRGRIGERPIRGLVAALESLGARIRTRDGGAPLTVRSGTLRGEWRASPRTRRASSPRPSSSRRPGRRGRSKWSWRGTRCPGPTST